MIVARTSTPSSSEWAWGSPPRIYPRECPPIAGRGDQRAISHMVRPGLLQQIKYAWQGMTPLAKSIQRTISRLGSTIVADPCLDIAIQALVSC